MSLPSDEDFARASARAEERFRNLDAVGAAVKDAFQNRCPIVKVFVLPGNASSFDACVFYAKDRDITECAWTGVSQEVIEAIYAELERAGRGRRPEIVVYCEFDSHENVVARFDGDYYERLR